MASIKSQKITEHLKSIPLPALENYSYSEAKHFSKNLDEAVGFKIDDVETQILAYSPHTPWAGLEPQVLQTPYPEIRMMLSCLDLNNNQRVVDLGAAYGRMGLVMAAFHPDCSFQGYEISPERVREGCRIYRELQLELPKAAVELIQDDITRSDFQLPEADVFFLYDFGSLESIIQILDRLKTLARKKPIRVVGRGRRTRDQIERNEPWLSQVNEPKHYGNFSVYLVN